MSPNDATARQLEAMGSERFEIGILTNHMKLRDWDAQSIAESIGWLRHMNANGGHIYVRPYRDNTLSLVDDLTAPAVSSMIKGGYQPSVVVETSPHNYQAWLNNGRNLTDEQATAAAQELARQFKSDMGAAHRREFGRLAPFANRKDKHAYKDTFEDWRAKNFTKNRQNLWEFRNLQQVLDRGAHEMFTGERLDQMYQESPMRYPPCKLHVAKHVVYDRADELLERTEKTLAMRHQQEHTLSQHFKHMDNAPRKTIEDFHRDPKYDGDFSRGDIAYALYAAAHKVPHAQIFADIKRSRDLSLKHGTLRQQDKYIQRTIGKALDRSA